MGLPVDSDDLAACVSCGLCLAYCPTYRVSREEGLSPRGRIAAMRLVDAGAAPDANFAELMQTCVQCRACETACPSAVPFGRLMEGAREVLAPRTVPAWQRLAYRSLGHHRLLLAGTALGALAQRLRLVPPRLSRRLSLPRLPLRQRALRPTGTDVWLFTGCVMDAWQRPAHRATLAVLEAMGVGVALPGPKAACCGALHVHAGLRSQARRFARRVMTAFPGDAPILVDSAGCGAALKDYGHLLGDTRARDFSARVFDIHEWIAARSDLLPVPAPRGFGGFGGTRGSLGFPGLGGSPGLCGPHGSGSSPGSRPRIAVQDPCHLRHVQRADAHVRTVLRPYGELVELPDEGRCCGAGGAYSALQPQLASQIRAEKVAAIDSVGADVVASANPGCALWLAGAGVPVRHPMELVAAAAGLEVT
jgi:glycolate dehydrogenase iron-sulfur subunit